MATLTRTSTQPAFSPALTSSIPSPFPIAEVQHLLREQDSQPESSLQPQCRSYRCFSFDPSLGFSRPRTPGTIQELSGGLIQLMFGAFDSPIGSLDGAWLTLAGQSTSLRFFFAFLGDFERYGDLPPLVSLRPAPEHRMRLADASD